jgi:hypothetical protein
MDGIGRQLIYECERIRRKSRAHHDLVYSMLLDSLDLSDRAAKKLQYNLPLDALRAFGLREWCSTLISEIFVLDDIERRLRNEHTPDTLSPFEGIAGFYVEWLDGAGPRDLCATGRLMRWRFNAPRGRIIAPAYDHDGLAVALAYFDERQQQWKLISSAYLELGVPAYHGDVSWLNYLHT